MATVVTTIPANTIKNSDCSSDMALERSKLALETKKFGIRAQDLRIHDAFQTALGTSASSDDLGMIIGTFGTDAVVVQSSDSKATTTTQRARFAFTLPHCYASGEAVSVVGLAGMKTTVSDTTATIDFEVYKKDTATALVGSDICATSATSINSLTAAAKTFTITPTGLVAGDELDIRVTIAITDGATATAVIGRIMQLYVNCDIRG